MLIITLSFPLFLFAEIIVVKTKSLHSLGENSDSIQNFLLTKRRFWCMVITDRTIIQILVIS